MRLFVTGATGLIGRRLVEDRLARGDSLIALTRNVERALAILPAAPREQLALIEADPAQGGDWQRSIDGCDTVVHLAGAGIADRRWTESYKQELISSRVESTKQVIRGIELARRRPALLINASAAGFYGDTAGGPVDEAANGPPRGTDFLADLTSDWEAAAHAAQRLGVRVVMLRTSVVLDARGGALARMLPIFKLGMGGPIASGRQWMSWIHWRDAIGLVDWVLRDSSIHGPINFAAPSPIANREFAAVLGAVLRRPSILPAPRFVLRLALGELANYLVANQAVVPAKALAAGYRFTSPDLEPALRDLVSRGGTGRDS
jgi:hypothetical protein